MAWSFDGQTKAVFDAAVTARPDCMRILSATPWLIKRVKIVADSNTAAEILHGQSVMPDLIHFDGAVDDPHADSTFSGYAGSTASYITIDTGRNGAGTVELTMIWFNAASGGISA